jgi:hypothetical protein
MGNDTPLTKVERISPIQVLFLGNIERFFHGVEKLSTQESNIIGYRDEVIHNTMYIYEDLLESEENPNIEKLLKNLKNNPNDTQTLLKLRKMKELKLNLKICEDIFK